MLHCDATLSNNFEVNWTSGGTVHHFHTGRTRLLSNARNQFFRIQPGSLDATMVT
jgi:hypothetical protein